jgi:hypothetical protein
MTQREAIAKAAPKLVKPALNGAAKAENDAFILAGDRGDSLLAKPPPVKWICRDLQLAAGGRPMLFVAFGGSGKTWCALDIAYGIATGAPKCMGSLNLQSGGDVLWLNFEMPRFELIRRCHRIAWARKVSAAADGAIEIVSRQHLNGMTLDDPRMKSALISALKGRTLCVIDSFRAAVGGLDENSSEVRRPLDDLLEVADVTGCAFIVLHHEGKPGDNPRDAIHRTRGSGAIVDAADTTWHLVSGDAAMRVEQGKVSLAQKRDPFHVRLRDVGDVDPDTGRSLGLEIEWMPEEQIAELEDAESPAVVRARAAIVHALKAHAMLTTNQITRSSSFVKGRGDAKRKALEALEADAVISGSKAKGWTLT